MAYGISYETPNGNVQIDSDTTNTGLIVISSAASATTVTFNSTKEILFAKPSSTTYTRQYLALRLVSGSSYRFEDISGNLVNTEYILAKWSNEQTTSASGYGLQVFNVDGDLAYDSTLYTGNGGIGIVAYAPQHTLSGAGSSSTSSLIDSDPDLYYSMNQTFAIGSSSQFIGYEFVKDASVGQGIGTYWLAYLVFDTGFGSTTISLPNFTPTFVAEGGSI